MTIWDPFDPITYFMHTIIGGAAILCALVALSVLKGSRPHINAGRFFAFGAIAAATTAIVFSATEFSPPAIASAVMTYAAIGGAIFALKPNSKSVAGAEVFFAVLMALVLCWLLFGAYMSTGGDEPAWIPPLLYSIFPAILLVNDIRFRRLAAPERAQKRLKRHFSRMAFALAIAVHAPIVSFADDWGIHPALAFFGPFIIWPLVVMYFSTRTAAVQPRTDSGAIG